MDFWSEMERGAPRSVEVAGVELGWGSRVRIRPRAGGDVLDLALAGRTAVVEGVEQDQDGRIHLAVLVDDDPGRDLGAGRHPGHRFFFSPDEVEPLDPAAPVESPGPRILVAGIGNVFLGDDGFGVEVARRLAARPLPAGVKVADFGIRGIDLAYALQDGYYAALLVDAAPRGGEPGTLYVLEPAPDSTGPAAPDGHGMDPARVLRLVQALGGTTARVLVVGCEPGRAATVEEDGDEMRMELTPPVQAAVGAAVELVETLIAELLAPAGGAASPPPEGTMP